MEKLAEYDSEKTVHDRPGGLCAMIAVLLAADAIPQTIILNRQGVAVCNAQAPLTHEKPEALYKQALEH